SGRRCSRYGRTITTTIRAMTRPSSWPARKRLWLRPGRPVMPPPRPRRWRRSPARSRSAEASSGSGRCWPGPAWPPRRPRPPPPPRRAAIIETDLREGMGQHEVAVAGAREETATAREHGLARTYYGVVLAINLAEPLVSLGRWDEAAEVIDRAVRLFPPRPSRSVLWRLSGDIALARGDLTAAAEAVAPVKGAPDAATPRGGGHLPPAPPAAHAPLG